MVSAKHLCKQELQEQVSAIHLQPDSDSSAAVASCAYGYFSAWKCCIGRTEDFGHFSNSPAGIMSLLDIQRCWTEGRCLANKSSLRCTCHEGSVAAVFITQALSYPADGLDRCSKSAPS